MDKQHIDPAELDEIAARVVGSRTRGNGFHPPGCRFRHNPPDPPLAKDAGSSPLDKLLRKASPIVSRLNPSKLLTKVDPVALRRNLDERFRKAKERLKAINLRSAQREAQRKERERLDALEAAKAQRNALALARAKADPVAFRRDMNETLRQAKEKMKRFEG